jgi:dimethylaniline monooxygenase (N-oxide forming)
MACFSNLPTERPPKDETYYDYFPARYVEHYLSEYVDRKTYGGRTLRQRIQFHTKVTKVEFVAAAKQWQLVRDGSSEPLLAPKLLVAAGLTSQPNMPKLPCSEAFQGTIIHHLDFGRSSIMKDPKVKHVAVLGGAKSAADISYSAAKAGKTVSWIIRKGGNGPAHFAPAEGMGPYKNSNEFLYTRLTTSLSPSIWNRQSWLSGVIHGSKLGRRVVDWIWGKFDSDLRREAGYHDRGLEASDSGFANLEPDTSYVSIFQVPFHLHNSDFLDSSGKMIAPGSTKDQIFGPRSRQECTFIAKTSCDCKQTVLCYRKTGLTTSTVSFAPLDGAYPTKPSLRNR